MIHSGTRDIAVIALGEGRFQPRVVKVGRTANGYVEILEGLDVGDSLVVSAQFLIDSESNLRAAIEQMRGGSVGAVVGTEFKSVPTTAQAPEDTHAR